LTLFESFYFFWYISYTTAIQYVCVNKTQ